MLALQRHPLAQDRLWETPGLIPRAAEEMLRYDAPAVDTPHRAGPNRARRDGHRGRRRHRDPHRGREPRPRSVHLHPDRFDLERPDTAALSIGWGIHHCIGEREAYADREMFWGSQRGSLPLEPCL